MEKFSLFLSKRPCRSKFIEPELQNISLISELLWTELVGNCNDLCNASRNGILCIKFALQNYHFLFDLLIAYQVYLKSITKNRRLPPCSLRIIQILAVLLVVHSDQLALNLYQVCTVVLQLISQVSTPVYSILLMGCEYIKPDGNCSLTMDWRASTTAKIIFMVFLAYIFEDLTVREHDIMKNPFESRRV